MFELTWQEFSRRPHIAKLPLAEQTRQFMWEQQRHAMLMEYVSSAASGLAAAVELEAEIVSLCNRYKPCKTIPLTTTLRIIM